MIRAFRVPDKQVAAASAMLPELVHAVAGAHIVSAASAEVLGKRARPLRELVEVELDAERWAETAGRLHAMWAAMVSEPLPEAVAIEARLMLYADRALELEFMGRGTFGPDHQLPADRSLLLALDIAGGRRTYMFRRLERTAAGRDRRMTRVNARYDDMTRWIRDPDARIVLSIGGGGFRMFAAIPVLKALDKIAGGRMRIDEVWGSSGGAFIGYAYAAGIPHVALDQFAFDLYNGRVPHLVNGSVASLVRARVGAVWDQLRGHARPPEMLGWLRELEARHPSATRAAARPFYAIASSAERTGLTALTAPEHLVASCADFMVGCDPRSAVAASSAVPFVLRPVRGIGDRPRETWFDGSISDENPLALPYLKWCRERAADPDGTPKRLKIVLVNLNLRTGQSALLRTISGSQLVDLLLDSKTATNIRLVTAQPGVEILAAKLNLGTLHMRGPRDIAKTVRGGRALESWQITLHRDGG